MKKFLLTLLNNIKPIEFDAIHRRPHKCSTVGCNHWARYAWWEETKGLICGKKMSGQKFGCYYHLGPYKNLPR